MRGRYGSLEQGLLLSDWIQKNTKLNGVPFSLVDHEFQKQIIDDPARHVVVKKCSQVGLTEIIVRVILSFLVRNQGTTTIMTQPTRSMALNFSTTRVTSIIEDSPLINNLLVKNVDSKELKQLGRSFLYIKGTKGASSAISVPADMIATDEFDFSDLEVVGKYNSRLSHSIYKLIKRFSTPTIPKFAISKEFELSTQNHYLMKCPHCGHYNNHDFFKDCVVVHPKYKNIRPEDLSIDDLVDLGPDDIQMLCGKCRRPLQYHDYTAAEWVAKYPNRYISGYQVRPWNTAMQRPFDLIRSREDYELYSDWVNFALGEDYIDSKQVFDISKIVKLEIAPSVPFFIGIDFGKICYLVGGFVDGKDFIVSIKEEISEKDIMERVKDLLSNYFIVGMVLDALPQTKLSSDIRELMDNGAYTAYYSDTQRELFSIKANDEDVSISRTKLFDRVLSINKLYTVKDKYQDIFEEHLTGMVKQRIKKEGSEIERYVKVKADHFLHALGYAYMANIIFAETAISVVLPDISTVKIK